MPEIIPMSELIQELGLLPAESKEKMTREELAGRINELLNSDFSRLISVLYRMDVSEPKLKQLLRENPEADAGLLIADLMIERQLQKIKTRRESRSAKPPDTEMDENEKW